MRLAPWIASTAMAWCAQVGCVSHRTGVGVGVLREDWSQPRRDPDPTRDPTREPGNPWAEDAEARRGPAGSGDDDGTPDPGDDDCSHRGRDELVRSVAGVAAVLIGGWTPLAEVHGTVEEDPEQRRRIEQEDRRRAARCRRRPRGQAEQAP
ncbi:MAG: hypothetical protein H6708_16165 [Kofleriaceae bacterium]|nr:hypothetical protein [Kofleriaceae bacterium]